LDALTSRSAALLSNDTWIVGVAQVVVLAGEQPPGKGVILSRQRAVTGGCFPLADREAYS
jgi:hypothetical protein